MRIQGKKNPEEYIDVHFKEEFSETEAENIVLIFNNKKCKGTLTFLML